MGTVRGGAFLHHLCGIHQKQDALQLKEKEEEIRQRKNVMLEILPMSNKTISHSLFICGPFSKLHQV